jgi:hypothetical protein
VQALLDAVARLVGKAITEELAFALIGINSHYGMPKKRRPAGPGAWRLVERLGGGTLSALAHAGAPEKLSYASTAGGAFLEWLEGKTLPGVAVLQRY